MLFVDLVAYTPLTEGWDAEDVRDLLTGYFEVANTIVERYGGMVEKFIGDAVVAAWGSQSSREDDAARAVRAGMEIVEAVASYGERRGLPGLSARAGVVTGQVASWVGADHGLVAGDRVNLAARVQSTAEPGSVFVDEVTMGATRSTLVYADAGERQLKGVAEPVPLWRVVRVAAGFAGARRADGLEAAFVGRGRELTLVKELYHATAEGGRARLVAVAGVAGIGKSRLSWEFETYLEGLAADALLHRGRCLSYGEGVAFWALAEMVRQRFDIAEDDDAETAVAKLAQRLPQWMPDDDERAFVAPRLGALVGAVDRELSRADLFAGWRLFFERLAALRPVVLVFEDLQWADVGLFEFIEYLLDWSAGLPIFLLTLARPELAERRQGWLGDRPNATLLHLEPLPGQAIRQLLEGLVPGMPEAVTAKITAHAGGIPLYAVEIIRSLVDKELVVPRAGVYRLEGDVEDLDVPTTLTAVIAARLDGLPPDERELVQGLAVLGDSFQRRAVAAVSDAPSERIDGWLRTLVHKEVLAVRSDPRSAERDHYMFVQAILRSVAHDRLTRRERKLRHRAVADHLRSTFPDDGADVAEVIAAHLLDAYTAARSDPEGESIRAEAETAYARAGARAGAVGSPDTAEKYYRTAADLTDNEVDRTRHTVLAAVMAERAGRPAEALALLETAADTHRKAGREVEAARLVAESGWLRLNYKGQRGLTLQLLNEALRVLEREGAQDELPYLHAMLAGLSMTEGPDRAKAAEHLERGLVLATALENHDALMAGLHTKAGLLAQEHRVVEAKALLSAVAELSRAHDDTEMEARAHHSLGQLLSQSDLPGAADELEASLVLSNRLGHALFQSETATELGLLHFFLGHWDESERYARQAVDIAHKAGLPDGREVLVLVLTARGALDDAEHELAALEALTDTGDPERSSRLDLARGITALAQGRLERAADTAGRAAHETFRLGGLLSSNDYRLAWPLSLEAALAANRVEEATTLLAMVADLPAGHVPPYLRAQLVRYRGLIGAVRGEHTTAEADLMSAVGMSRELGYPYWLARAQMDLARWLIDQDRPGYEQLLIDAAESFARLGARPDLDLVHSLQREPPAGGP